MSLVLPSREEIDKIKQGDILAISGIYEKNYNIFKYISMKQCRKVERFFLVGDCLNQIFLELKDYDFKDLKTFYWHVRRSLWRAIGNDCGYISLQDYINGEEELTFEGLFGCEDKDENEEREQVLKCLSIINGLCLSGRDNDYLLAKAFDIKEFRGLFELVKKQYGYEISDTR